MTMTGRKTTPGPLWLLALLVMAALIAPASSRAAFEIVPESVEVQTVDAEGNPDLRAGAHPDRLVVKFKLSPDGSAMRDFTMEFGPGLVATTAGIPVCSRAEFEDNGCPPDTRVGTYVTNLGENEPGEAPLYNIAPPPGQTAAFGFQILWQTELGVTLNPRDDGLTMAMHDMTQVPGTRGKVELWGVPADHIATEPPKRVAMLASPPSCGSLEVTLRVRSWEPEAPLLSQTAETPPYSGCEELPFAPEFEMALTNDAPDSPSGAEIELYSEVNMEPDAQVGANMKTVSMKFPPGVTMSPGGVEGVEVCTDAEFGAHTDSMVTCPPRSRVGTVEIETPQLEEATSGPVFLGQEAPGQRFRLFIDAEAPGAKVKTIGRLVPNPETGQLTAILSDLPQVALSSIWLDLSEGAAPLLATPLSCVSGQATATFLPYGPQAPVDSAVPIGLGTASCPSPPGFSPQVLAGSTALGAGSGTGFTLTLTRHSGEQLVKRLSTTFPAGLNADVTGIQRCADAAAAAGQCGADSKVGSAVAEVGSGAETALVRGNVYLTDAYRGAPFGVLIAFDATVGPFHLGSFDVRGALRVDPETGQLELETDPLPLVFEGLALRFQTMGIDLDRPGFLLNPTSCDARQITSTITAVDGRVATVSDPFHVGNCQALSFKPRPKLELKIGKGHAKPKLSIGVKTRNGDANLRQFKMKFPSLLAFHARAVKAVCARGDAEENLCPKASRVGTAVAHTPLLNEALRGPVYLVQPRGGGFPDFWGSLEGEGVRIQVKAESVQRHGNLTTELTGLPDVPFTTLTMSLDGGQGGLFTIKGDACGRSAARRSMAPVKLQAQNGASTQKHVRLKASCAAGGRK